MASKSAILSVKILADSAKFTREMDKASGKAGKFSSGLKKVAAGVGLAVLAGEAKDMALKAEAAATANSRLANVLKQTAGASDGQVSAVQKQAEKLSTLIGVDDEVIKQGQAILGTFKSVASSAGETGGVFDRATTAAADLAAAGFGSIESNSVQLGKALEDPTKGLTALTRSGVTFTEGQKKQIKAMQKAGDLAGAQNLVLKAVEGQVAGTAAATADGSAKMQVAWNNVQEVLGSVLLPIIDVLATKFQEMATWAKDNASTIKALAIAFGVIIGALVAATAAIKVYEITTKTLTIATKIFGVVSKATWLTNPITLVVLAVVALVAAIVYLWNKHEGFRKVVLAVWEAIKVAALATWEWIKSAAQAVWTFLQAAWQGIQDAATAAWNFIKAVVNIAIKLVIGYIRFYLAVAKAVWTAIKVAAQAAWNFVASIIRGVIDTAKRYINGFKVGVGLIWDAIKSKAKTIWDGIKSTISTVVGAVKSTIEGIKSTFTNVFDAITSPVDTLRAAFDRVVSAIQSVKTWLGSIQVPDWISSITGAVGSFLGGGSPATQAAMLASPHFAMAAAPNAPTSYAAAGYAAGASGGITITVNGALDPDAVARQIGDILARRNRRTGPVTIGRYSTVGG